MLGTKAVIKWKTGVRVVLAPARDVVKRFMFAPVIIQKAQVWNKCFIGLNLYWVRYFPQVFPCIQFKGTTRLWKDFLYLLLGFQAASDHIRVGAIYWNLNQLVTRLYWRERATEELQKVLAVLCWGYLWKYFEGIVNRWQKVNWWMKSKGLQFWRRLQACLKCSIAWKVISRQRSLCFILVIYRTLLNQDLSFWILHAPRITGNWAFETFKPEWYSS